MNIHTNINMLYKYIFIYINMNIHIYEDSKLAISDMIIMKSLLEMM